jgi:hypothetical protein
MRVPPNKRHLVVNKEYSRLPYWTDDGFEDVQRQTSQKYVQDSFGAFAESENQLPYLSDADYQELEYRYQDPKFPDFPDIPISPNTAPKGTCYQLWVSLFGDATGAFIPNANEWNKLNEYAKKCPLIYMPHICCLNMKITGPDSVAPGDTVEYSVSGGKYGCAYDIDAERGEFIGYKYTAPTTPGSDRLSIKPWMSDDQHTICASKDITIEGGCKGTVHATTLQMTVGASQTLYIEGGSDGDTYYWSTTSGSLSSPTGTSVTYTAPATNPNCVNNPTITVTCGGATIGTLTIAVNAYTGSGDAYRYGVPKSEFQCFYRAAQDDCTSICATANSNYYHCDGSFSHNGDPSFVCGAGVGLGCHAGLCNKCGFYENLDCCTIDSPWCANNKALYCTECDTGEEAATHLPLTDLRDQAMKVNGCCSAILL